MIKLPSRVSFRATQWIILLQNLFSFFNQIYFRYEHSINYKPFHGIHQRWQTNDRCLKPFGSRTQWNPYSTFLESVRLSLDKFRLWCTKGCYQNHWSFLILFPPRNIHTEILHLFIEHCPKFSSTCMNINQMDIADTVTELGVPTLLTLSEVLLY